MKHRDFLLELIREGACIDAIEWVVENQYDMETAIRKCERKDWLSWFFTHFLSEFCEDRDSFGVDLMKEKDLRDFLTSPSTLKFITVAYKELNKWKRED